MRHDTEIAKPAQEYAAAHAAHHTTKDFHEALQLYKGIVAAHPNSREAGYSRTQIQNIVNHVVPKQDLLDAQMKLALDHLAREEPPEVEATPVTSLASEVPS